MNSTACVACALRAASSARMGDRLSESSTRPPSISPGGETFGGAFGMCNTIMRIGRRGFGMLACTRCIRRAISCKVAVPELSKYPPSTRRTQRRAPSVRCVSTRPAGLTYALPGQIAPAVAALALQLVAGALILALSLIRLILSLTRAVSHPATRRVASGGRHLRYNPSRSQTSVSPSPHVRSQMAHLSRLLLAAVTLLFSLHAAADPADLRKLAHEYYQWRDAAYPVATSGAGDHRFDARLTDYKMSEVLQRRQHVGDLLTQVSALATDGWSKDDRVDRILFQSQLAGVDFFGRKLSPESADPQLYVNECTNALFSLLQKDYASHRTRALAAAARLEQMPALLRTARVNLTQPVKLYASLAIEAARGGDELYTVSLMTLADQLSAGERKRLVKARDGAIKALHEYADWLDAGLSKMPDWQPMGEAAYNDLLKHVLLLPFDAHDVAHLGEVELARYRALEAMLKDPSLASPDPARAKHVPKDQAEFLAAYESRLQEIVDFLQANRLVTLPSYLGPFQIRPLPEAFKPTSPGGFMNPPGLYDKDPGGFYFIPTYNPKSGNFYIRAAIEDPRPILGHEGIPGHFLQISIANHLGDEIRRQHGDSVFVEGWALYGEEMLMREGLYPDNSASQGQILRLSRYRAARIGVDVNLQSGRWSFEQAVRYFMEGGGLDREAAQGEAAGAASNPSQKISYITGKWQIMRLLGRYRDAQGANFRLGAFHDQLISYGSLPVSVIEWLMFDDDSSLREALK
jgi:uncharacterized protein (DUF885 family)